MRLIDADQFGVISLQGKSEEFIDGVLFMFDKIHEAPTIEERPHGEWIEHRQFNPIGCFYSEYECSNCHDDLWQKTEWQFCPNCGASMSANDKQVTGKLNEEPKDSHAEYWNSIGEWKEGDEK